MTVYTLVATLLLLVTSVVRIACAVSSQLHLGGTAPILGTRRDVLAPKGRDQTIVFSTLTAAVRVLQAKLWWFDTFRQFFVVRLQTRLTITPLTGGVKGQTGVAIPHVRLRGVLIISVRWNMICIVYVPDFLIEAI